MALRKEMCLCILLGEIVNQNIVSAVPGSQFIKWHSFLKKCQLATEAEGRQEKGLFVFQSSPDR